MFNSPTLIIVTIAIGANLCSGACALLADRHYKVMRWLVFPLLALSGLACMIACLLSLTGSDGFAIQLPMGLPWLHWHLHFDTLSAFFLGIIGVISFAVSLFGPGYIREYRHHHYSLTVLGLATSLFVAGMQFVVLADDAFAFMIAWELMSVSSYFLVAFEHRESANRRAAFLYLLMAQIGALLILLSFGVLASVAGDFTFDTFRAVTLSPLWAGIAFGLSLAGFGMKAGIVPLHVWLPEAHPVAPSHISALMSGVMVKIAVYGFIRLSFDLLGEPQWTWGVIILLVGSLTALYGVLYALMQNDLKRLLAFSTVENIGIIYIGLGLSMIFFGVNQPTFGVLGMIAALYHTLSHALFKSLLFLGAGAIIQHGHERNLEHMGGLIHRMPWTSLFFLIGCISISALPPFNGFVSEWLTFQTALQATSLSSGTLRAVIPITAALLALTGALAAACFVKVYGIAFLGRPRGRRVHHAHEATKGMVWAQGLLATLCLVFGVFPSTVIEALNRVTNELTGHGVGAAISQGWMWLTPVAPAIASYNAPVVLLGMLVALGIWASVYLLRKRRRQHAVQRQEPWDCGFGPLTARMQYTATSFAMPIRQIFQPIWLLREQSVRQMSPLLPTQPLELRYLIHTDDISWNYFYQPIENIVRATARKISRIQTGHLRHYLAYSFFTLIILLWLIT